MIAIFIVIFFAYRVYKTAKDTGRDALAWTLGAIFGYIGIQLVVGFTFGIIMALGEHFWGWSADLSNRYQVIANIVAGLGGLAVVVFISRYVGRIPEEKTYNEPPVPPAF